MYPNELQTPDSTREIASLRKRLEELERRAPFFTDDDPPEGCCSSYCCVESPFEDLEIGEIGDYCSFDPDPVGGVGMRVKVSGWVKVSPQDAGSAWVRTWVDIDGVEYVGDPELAHTVASGDRFTLPIGNTIDVAVADPTITIRVQNQGTPTMRVLQVYSRVEISAREGSVACGEPAGQ